MKEEQAAELAAAEQAPDRSRSFRVPLALVGVVVAILGTGVTLLRHAEANVDSVALASSPKGVTVVPARATTFRESRRYVGTLEPWLQATLGPQLVSAFVSDVLVRPGERVKRGQILAKLDCQSSAAADRAVALQARALAERQRALASETSRFQGLLERGFVSPNEVEQRQAQTAAEGAQLAALQAQSSGKRLEVNDCILRAPFDGEVATRVVDPGAFVRPGGAVVSLVDRQRLRLVVDVPETDFDAVQVATPVSFKLLASGQALEGKVSRRSPAADGATRTVRFEVDIDPEGRDLPTGSTAEVSLLVGQASPAQEVPLVSAKVRGTKASLFTIVEGKAKELTLPVLGERDGYLYLSGDLAPGAPIVTEGRGRLGSGDRVVFKTDHRREAGRSK